MYICTPIWGNDSVAQLVEQYTFNVRVLGSSPSGITKGSLPKGSYDCLFNMYYFGLRQQLRCGNHTVIASEAC